MDPRDVPDMLDKHDPVASWITVFLVVVTLLGAGIAWLQAQAHREHDEATVQAEQWSVLASSQQGRANQVALLSAGRRWRIRRDRIGADQAAAAVALGGSGRLLSWLEEGQWKNRAKDAEVRAEILAEQEAAELEEIEPGVKAAFPGIDPSVGLEASCEGIPRAPPEPSIAAAPLPTRSPPALEMAPGMAQGEGVSPNTVEPDVEREPSSSTEAAVGNPAHSTPPAASYSRIREAYRMEGLRDAAERIATQAEKQFTYYALALAVIAVALFLFGYALTKYGFRYRRRLAATGLGLTVGALVFASIALFSSPDKPPPAAAAAYADGRVALEHGESRVALGDFRCANELDPDFAAAFLGRSEATGRLGQQRGTALINLGTLSGANVRRSLAYAQRAGGEDSDDPRVLDQIATSLYIQGFRLRDRTDLQEALALNEQIEEELRGDPIAAFNAGADRLALGPHWRGAYHRAGKGLRATSQRLEYVGSALTDIDTLQQSNLRPGIAAEAREAKEEVVSLATGVDPPAAGADDEGAQVSLDDVRLSVTPHVATVSFTSRHIQLDDVFVAVYREKEGLWQELQLLTPPKSLEPPVNGRYETSLAYDTPTLCLESGTYKVELYVDGRLANAGGAAEETVRLPQLERRILPGINVRLCVPPEAAGWRRIAGRSVGLVDGFERSGRRREGVVVADLSAAPVHGARALAALALRRFPILPSHVRQIGPPRRVDFEGPTRAIGRFYRYPGGELTMAIGTTPIGRRLAIAVFGPPAFFAVRAGMSQSMAESLFGSVGPQDISPFSTTTDSSGG